MNNKYLLNKINYLDKLNAIEKVIEKPTTKEACLKGFDFPRLQWDLEIPQYSFFPFCSPTESVLFQTSFCPEYVLLSIICVLRDLSCVSQNWSGYAEGTNNLPDLET